MNLSQDPLRNLQGPVQNENAGHPVQNLGRISRRQLHYNRLHLTVDAGLPRSSARQQGEEGFEPTDTCQAPPLSWCLRLVQGSPTSGYRAKTRQGNNGRGQQLKRSHRHVAFVAHLTILSPEMEMFL